MFRYFRPFSTFTLTSHRTCWDPTESLNLSHPVLVLLEKCRTRDHFKQILAQMMRVHLTTHTFPMSRLIYFSAISYPENLDMAILLFNRYTRPNLYIYNTMISALSLSNQSFLLYNSMLQSYIYPDKHTFLYLLKASKCLSEVKQTHSHAIVTGFVSYSYFQNSLMKMYLEYGQMSLARLVFQQMSIGDAVPYNVMILGLARKGHSLEVLQLFHDMVGSSLDPDEFTMVALLMCCGQLGNMLLGKSVHAWIERRQLFSACNLILGNALLDMYVKCEEMKIARRVFDQFVDKDIISWNTMIAGYAKIGEMELSSTFFDLMPSKDLVSWNSLIEGYRERGDCSSVMNIFNQMLIENVCPDKVTVISVVRAAAESGTLDQGRWIHGWVVRNGMELDAFLGSALIDMYCKCGNIERALIVFEMATERDVTLWTAMISGFAFHGHGGKALELFWEMQKELRPNEVTFVAVLTACSHCGMVEPGLEIFNSMKKNYGIEPGVEHYGCLVDLLGRAGRLADAKDVIEKMPIKPSGSVWGAMLSACKAYGDVELAETALMELLKLEPEKEGGYVLLSNIYAAFGRWTFSDKIREIMGTRGVKKTAGCSSLVVNGIVHRFIAEDKQHPRWIEIHAILLCLRREMKSEPTVSSEYMQESYLN
ncbi:pentatricopeptide repeat-containing protein At3g04750, mitochondrial [Macadamia integrifolia]|uniref:pentatricopeptide repeat-containing protein At3g04750, mitochondrial n=1 Tax=Macadamia integrifolia TaxID=60698 RepID=UPI001C4EBBA5|nr:pentatricopeptide repeat-containing protein At3g04750, mitochondrial [Macadamia integrifolia]